MDVSARTSFLGGLVEEKAFSHRQLKQIGTWLKLAGLSSGWWWWRQQCGFPMSYGGLPVGIVRQALTDWRQIYQDYGLGRAPWHEETDHHGQDRFRALFAVARSEVGQDVFGATIETDAEEARQNLLAPHNIEYNRFLARDSSLWIPKFQGGGYLGKLHPEVIQPVPPPRNVAATIAKAKGVPPVRAAPSSAATKASGIPPTVVVIRGKDETIPEKTSSPSSSFQWGVQTSPPASLPKAVPTTRASSAPPSKSPRTI